MCTLSRSRGHGSVAASLTFADICDDGTSMRNGIRVKGLGQISVTGSGSATVERKYEGKAFKTKVGLFQVKTSAQAEISGSVKITVCVRRCSRRHLDLTPHWHMPVQRARARPTALISMYVPCARAATVESKIQGGYLWPHGEPHL